MLNRPTFGGHISKRVTLLFWCYPLCFSVTMVQKKIVAGSIKIEDLYFDCSFFPAAGLKRYMYGTNGTWSDVTIWDKKGKIVKQLSYDDWIRITNNNTK